MRIPTQTLSALVVATSLLLAACGNDAPAADMSQQQAAPRVETMTAELTSVPNTIELSGRARAYTEAEIRPQVTGLIKERLFKEGDVVQKGQALYQIDAAEYAAAARSAEASLERAQATADVARETANRYKRLAEINAVSQQEYDQAVASARQAEADISMQKAALDRTRIDLARTKITSPITGTIGRSSVTQGALVTQNQAEPLAHVLQLDPVYVDLTVSSSRILNWRQQMASGEIATTERRTIPVNILLSDNDTNGLVGDLEFSEVNVDESAGTVAVRVVVPNPDGIILPGMFVRANFSAGNYEGVFLLPQSVVSRSATGQATVMIVKDDGTLEQRVIEIAEQMDNSWIVTSGLKPGEKIAVSNLQSIRPGMKVTPISEASKLSASQDARGGSK